MYGINDFGTTVGYYETMPGGYFNGFMMTGKTATTIDYPGAYNTICYGINNSGEVVGQYVDTEGFYYAFEYENGTYTIMDPPGATYAGAGAINNLGEIAGVYTDAEGSHGFILSGTTYQTLNVPGAAYTLWGGGINDSGDVTLQWSSGTTRDRRSTTARPTLLFRSTGLRTSWHTGSTIVVTSPLCGRT